MGAPSNYSDQVWLKSNVILQNNNNNKNKQTKTKTNPIHSENRILKTFSG